jgi:hypothetical protein
MLTITGISSIEGNTIIYFDIAVDGITYQWAAKKSNLDTRDVQTYINDNEALYAADITSKVNYWYSSECPHTKDITDPMGETITVEIPMSDVVKPTLMTPLDTFDSKRFFGRVIQELSSQRWFELSKLGVGWTLDQLINYPNQEGLDAYISGLLADGTFTQDDVTKVVAVFLEQGVIITVT